MKEKALRLGRYWNCCWRLNGGEAEIKFLQSVGNGATKATDS